MKPGLTATGAELIAFAKERLAAYKYPRSIEFRSALPKGATGKILKEALSPPSSAASRAPSADR